MRIILLLVFPLSALFLSVGYSRFAEHRLEVYRGFSSLLSYLKGRVGTHLTPIKEAFSAFSDDALAASGFIESVREGERLYDAFRLSRDRLCISKRVGEILDGFFSDFGTGYLDAELSGIEYTQKELESAIRAEEEELSVSVRLVRSLLLLAAVGIVILLI